MYVVYVAAKQNQRAVYIHRMTKGVAFCSLSGRGRVGSVNALHPRCCKGYGHNVFLCAGSTGVSTLFPVLHRLECAVTVHLIAAILAVE